MASTMSEYKMRKAEMFAYLGGMCKKCGSTDSLRIDHIDPKLKSFNISSNWARSWNILKKELDKCQLLCKIHHLEKSIQNKEFGGGQNRLNFCPHGTVYGYSGRWKCRCADCTQAKSEEYYKRTYGT